MKKTWNDLVLILCNFKKNTRNTHTHISLYLSKARKKKKSNLRPVRECSYWIFKKKLQQISKSKHSLKRKKKQPLSMLRKSSISCIFFFAHLRNRHLYLFVSIYSHHVYYQFFFCFYYSCAIVFPSPISISLSIEPFRF